MSIKNTPTTSDMLLSKYRLGQELGRGGMGVVYEALHLRLGQRVAIKMVLAEVGSQPELAHRFEREARAAARLKSRHTARVLDVDSTAEGIPFLVMEYLEGWSLREELARVGPLPMADAVRYVLEACEAMDEAHRAGIIHRDLKPSNLFLCREGGRMIVKVLDFGISKAPSESHASFRTATNVPLGTCHYMSPEQARSARSVDARSDVWSLGVVLYELLSGEVPFGGDNPLNVLVAVATQPVPSLRALRPDVPEALEAAIERALCKNVEGRYPTVRSFAEALTPFYPSFAGFPSEDGSHVALANTPSGRAGFETTQVQQTPTPVRRDSTSAGLGSSSGVNRASRSTLVSQVPRSYLGLAGLAVAGLLGVGVWLVRPPSPTPTNGAGVSPLGSASVGPELRPAQTTPPPLAASATPSVTTPTAIAPSPPEVAPADTGKPGADPVASARGRGRVVPLPPPRPPTATTKSSPSTPPPPRPSVEDPEILK